MRLIFILILILFTERSFCQQVIPTDEYIKIGVENKSIRKKGKFKYSKKRFHKKIDFNLIDTNAVYVTAFNANQYKPELKPDSQYVFYRFFGDAMFQSGPYQNFPDSTAFDNLEYGKWRCYTMNKKKLLIIETPKMFEMDSRWEYYYLKIFPDRIETIYYHNTTLTFGSSPSYIKPSWVNRKISATFNNRKVTWLH